MNNDITRRREEKGKTSVIGIIIQVLVCKRCSLIDLAVLVALTIIDLLKPYFLIISGFKFAVTQITML